MKKTAWPTLPALAAGVLAATLSPATAANPPKAAGASTSLSSGQAAGTLTVDGKDIPLTHAAAFVDQEDKAKPVLLLLTDQAVPVAGWKSHMEIMPYHMDHRFNGMVFGFDKDRKVTSAEFWAGSFPASTTGFFTVKLEGTPGSSLVGTAESTAAAAASEHHIKLAVRFRADLK
jgi:hypothetical protein